MQPHEISLFLSAQLQILFVFRHSSMPADMTMLADHTARQLLDFSQKLDINLLDNVVNSMYYDVGSQVRLERGGTRVYHPIWY